MVRRLYTLREIIMGLKYDLNLVENKDFYLVSTNIRCIYGTRKSQDLRQGRQTSRRFLFWRSEAVLNMLRRGKTFWTWTVILAERPTGSTARTRRGRSWIGKPRIWIYAKRSTGSSGGRRGLLSVYKIGCFFYSLFIPFFPCGVAVGLAPAVASGYNVSGFDMLRRVT